MESLRQELRHAARTLRAHPGFTLTAVLTLALGIGASTAIFSVANAVLLRPLPYAGADRMVLLWGELRARDVHDFPFPPGDFRDLQERTSSFEALAAVTPFRSPLAGDGGDPEQVRAIGVTPELLPLLGARILHGRGFVAEDALPQPQPPDGAGAAGAPPPGPPLPQAVVLNHDFWQRRFGGDPGVVGRTLDMGNVRAHVVGVLAPGLELLWPPAAGVDRVPDLFSAMRIDYETASRNNVFLRVVGRLRPGVPVERAREEVERVAADLRERFPIKKTSDLHFHVEPMHEDLVAEVRPAILALMGAVVFVLLIACANVANLLLVRAGARTRELAVRAALGGSPARLVRQLLSESLLLGGAGAAAGLALAWIGIRLLLAIAPADLARLDAVRIDAAVLAFTVGATLLAVALFGIVPALRASRPDLAEVLRASGRSPALQGGSLLRSGVVMAEVALSFVLLVGCGLMVRSFVALQRTDPGYDPRGVLTFAVNPLAESPDGRAAFMRSLRERLLALPGVEAVTAATPIPLDGDILNSRWGTQEAATDPSKFQQANVHIVLPGYFQAMRARVVAGRVFDETDDRPDATGIVIDERLAAKAFPGRSAVGERLLVRVRSPEPEWLTVLGVVGHERHETLAADGREAIYFTDGFFGHGAAGRWAVRTRDDPASLAASARAAVRDLDPRLPVAEVQPMRVFVDRAMSPTRFALVLIASFGGIAAALACVGLYGVLSTVVRQRTAEIGVRMAFGARGASIFRLVIGEGLRLSALGILLGVAAAWALTRIMASMLVGVEPTDPATFAAIALLFLGIAAVACWIPARRAAAVDPVTALREE